MNPHEIDAEKILEQSNKTTTNKIIPMWLYLNTKGKVTITIIKPKIAMIKMKVSGRFYYAIKCVCHEKQKFEEQPEYIKPNINHIFLSASETAYPQLISFLKNKDLLNKEFITIEIQQINNYYYNFKIVNIQNKDLEKLINLIIEKDLINILNYNLFIVDGIGHKNITEKFNTNNKVNKEKQSNNN